MKSINKIFTIFAAVILFSAAAFAQTSLPALDGGSVNVEAQDGKVVILAIGASWLPLSVKQAEYTNTLATRLRSKNVVIYFVTTDSANAKSKNYASDQSIQSFATKNKLSVPVLRDSDGAALMKRYKYDQVPSFVILDKSGNQAGEAFGGIDPKFDITVPIIDAVNKLL